MLFGSVDPDTVLIDLLTVRCRGSVFSFRCSILCDSDRRIIVYFLGRLKSRLNSERVVNDIVEIPKPRGRVDYVV